MRIMSVSQMKGRGFIQLWPADGTKLKAVWDLLQANKGKFVDVYPLFDPPDKCKRTASYRRQLTDFWGLDIAYKPKGVWCLVGEWKGKEYVDYLAEKYK